MAKNRLPNTNDWNQLKRASLIILGFVIIMFAIYDKNITHLNNTRLLIWSGTYWETIPYVTIDSVSMVESIPNLKTRVNGYSAFGTKKGYFKKYGGKKIKLFINKANSKSIGIYYDDAKELYLNFDDSKDTKALFYELKEK